MCYNTLSTFSFPTLTQSYRIVLDKLAGKKTEQIKLHIRAV